MTDPLVPNYKDNVGRLATDRFDFQKHIEGSSFKHPASAIDLFPTVVIDGDTVTNTQDAIIKLADFANTPIADASTSQKGVVQLAGDLGGTATNVRVVGLRGFAINTSSPNTGDVLTWNGTSWGPVAPVSFSAGGDLSGIPTSQTVIGLQTRPVKPTAPNVSDVLMWDGTGWTPSTVPNQFSAGGDLQGTVSSQQIFNISGGTNGGNNGFISVSTSRILFGELLNTPTITQSIRTATDGYDMNITAQASGLSVGIGGTVNITGGKGGVTTNNGGVSLRIGTTVPSYMAHCTQLNHLGVNRRFLGLVTNSALTTTQVGANVGGDLVVFVGDRASAPTIPPVGGLIFYSESGKLKIYQSNGNLITVGESPNPNIWGSVVKGSLVTADGQVYEVRNIQSTVGATGATFTFPIAVPDHTAVYFDVKIVGKQDSASTNMAWFHMSAGFSREGGSLTQATTRDNNTDGYLPFGATNPYIEHARYTSSAFSWTTKPTIGTSGTSLTVVTGGHAATTITWFIHATMMIGPSYSSP